MCSSIHPSQPPPCTSATASPYLVPVIIKIAARVYWLQRNVNMDHNKLLAQYIYTYGIFVNDDQLVVSGPRSGCYHLTINLDLTRAYETDCRN